MKSFPILAILAAAAAAQTQTAGIAGTVLDEATRKPIPVALVMAIREGLPPLARSTKSGADGAFRIDGLPAGRYSLCVQTEGQLYVDPCLWGGSPAVVTVAAGQTAAGVSLALAAASVVTIHVRDPQKFMSQKSPDGRRPDLMLGVWGPKGLYYPARPLGDVTGQATGYTYSVAVPRNTALRFHIASRALRLGDAAGVALAGNAGQQAFQQTAGDVGPKRFEFTVLGLVP